MSNENNKNILTDEEVSEASGGTAFNKCPLGHYEATGFANVLGPNSDCRENRCGQCEIKLVRTLECPDGFGNTIPEYTYSFHCGYFNRTTNKIDRPAIFL